MEKVRRVLCFVMAFVIVFTAAGEDLDRVQAAGKKHAVLKAYKKKLRSASSNSNDGFFVYDLNHDGVPELVMREVSDMVVYTYYKNKVTKVDSFAGGEMMCYYPKGSIFISGRYLQGCMYESLYTIKKGKLKRVASSACMDDGTGSEYYVGGKKTTRKKYKAYEKKMTKRSKANSWEFYQVNSTNIKKYVK